MIGSFIGHYRIDARLGAGGMGVVYRAYDTRLERPVAIKFFSEVAAVPTRRRRLLHEARAASALNHPNVCTIHEVGESGDTPYLVMEFIDGRPLREMIPTSGLPIEAVVRYGAQIASALTHAHSRGVIHRDLKCVNVIVTPEDHVKVLDFGLAYREASGQSRTPTKTENTLQDPARAFGTVPYMSPEALRGELVDRRSDIWALGIVLYEMACGRQPFRGQTSYELSGQILHAPPEPFPDSVPDALRAIVLRCIAKDPYERFNDAADVRAALEAVQPSTSVSQVGVLERDAALGRRSLLVLPFTNVTEDPETDYFADGLTDEVISDLSNVRRLRVISRTSSMQLKGSTRTIAELGDLAKVEYVLEGGIRRFGGALRITARLIEVATDSSVWGEKFDGKLEDVFAMQHDLSRAIVRAMRVVLTKEEADEMTRHPIGDIRAYEWYLRARQEMLRYTKEGLDRAIEYLDSSLAIVGENALLLATKGEAYWQYVNSGVSADPRHLDAAEACARRALDLDPTSPDGHRLVGLVMFHRGDPGGALRRIGKALERDPNDVDSLLWACLLSTTCGQLRKGKAWAARLVEVDPITPFFQLMPATLAWASGDYEKAASGWEKRHAAVLETPVMRFAYGQALIAAGRSDEGRRELEETARALPDNSFGQLAAVFLDALAGDRDRVRAGLTPSLIAALEGDPQYCWHVAQCHALVGAVDEGILWVENAMERGFVNHLMLASRDPFLQNLRGDARWPALMEKAERRMNAIVL